MSSFLLAALLLLSNHDVAVEASRIHHGRSQAKVSSGDEIFDRGATEEVSNSSALLDAGSSVHCRSSCTTASCAISPSDCGSCDWCMKNDRINCRASICTNLPSDCTAQPVFCGGCSTCEAPAAPDLTFNFHTGTLPIEKRVEGGWAHIPHPTASLAETSSNQSVQPMPVNSACERRHLWQSTGRSLGKGANGMVTEVTGQAKGSKTSGSFALKQSLSPEGEADIVWEKSVLQKSKGCTGVMDLTDSKPCLSNGAMIMPIGVAYVSPKMGGNLWDWIDGKDPAQHGRVPTPQVVMRCGQSVHAELYQALNCFHSSGFVHGDLKGDNVFYTSVDRRTGCPTGVKLADFGLTKVINAKEAKYPAEYYHISGHLPGSVFVHAPNQLGLASRSEPHMYYARAAMDWCSYVYMMLTNFHIKVTIPGQRTQDTGNCGFMGSDRRQPILLDESRVAGQGFRV